MSVVVVVVVVGVVVRNSTYRSQFSSEWDQIWTQHVFLKCLEVLFLIFWNFEFWPPFWSKIGFFKDHFGDKMTYTNRMRVIFIRSSPNFNTTCIPRYNDFLFWKNLKFWISTPPLQKLRKNNFQYRVYLWHIKLNPLAYLSLIWAPKTFFEKIEPKKGSTGGWEW